MKSTQYWLEVHKNLTKPTADIVLIQFLHEIQVDAFHFGIEELEKEINKVYPFQSIIIDTAKKELKNKIY